MNDGSVATRRLASMVSIAAAVCVGIAVLSTWVNGHFVGDTFQTRHETFVSGYDVFQLKSISFSPWGVPWWIAVPTVAIGSMAALLVAGGVLARSRRGWIPFAILAAACAVLVSILATRSAFNGQTHVVTYQHVAGWEVSQSRGNGLLIASVGAYLGFGSLLLYEAASITSWMRGVLYHPRNASVNETASGSPGLKVKHL